MNINVDALHEMELVIQDRWGKLSEDQKQGLMDEMIIKNIQFDHVFNMKMVAIDFLYGRLNSKT